MSEFFIIKSLVILGVKFGGEILAVLDKELILETLCGWVIWKIMDFLWEKIKE